MRSVNKSSDKRAKETRKHPPPPCGVYASVLRKTGADPSGDDVMRDDRDVREQDVAPAGR
jgi:hypothetical protein